jgi:hypothetical protein
MKKLTPWFLAALAPALAIGCSGTTFIGHIAVVMVTVGIFVGTLSMGRQARLGSSRGASETESQSSSDTITTNVDLKNPGA